MKHVELEYKWGADTPRAFSRMLKAVQTCVPFVSEAQLQPITDVYLDDEAERLSRQKIALRVRRCGNAWEATYKTKTELVDGKAVRREETLPLTGVCTLPEALDFLRCKKEWDGLPLERLRVQFVIKNKRTLRRLGWEDGTEAELAFDSCAVCVSGRTLLMKEIELEFKGGAEETFSSAARLLTQRSGLPAAQISKVKTAVSLRGLWKVK